MLDISFVSDGSDDSSCAATIPVNSARIAPISSIFFKINSPVLWNHKTKYKECSAKCNKTHPMFRLRILSVWLAKGSILATYQTIDVKINLQNKSQHFSTLNSFKLTS